MDAWIESVAPQNARGTLAALYQRFGNGGEVDHIVQAHSLVPKAVESLLVFYKGVMHGDNDLPYVEREILAVCVSVLNHCHY